MRLMTKNGVNYREFEGNYVRVRRQRLETLFAAYKERAIDRTALRVFAARLEHSGLHPESKVDLYRIVNAGSGTKGIRRLTHREIERGLATLDRVLPEIESRLEGQEPAGGELKPVARRFLRHIAKGATSNVESLFLLFYCYRRLRPPRGKAMQRLKPNERYARIRYDDLASAIGVHPDTLSRTLTRLQQRGLLNTAMVHKQNENAYGQLFIDGPMVSLTRKRQSAYRRRYRWKHRIEVKGTRNVNSPRNKTSTLTKNHPKTRNSTNIFSKERGRSFDSDPEIIRMRERARQMKEHFQEQAA